MVEAHCSGSRFSVQKGSLINPKPLYNMLQKEDIVENLKPSSILLKTRDENEFRSITQTRAKFIQTDKTKNSQRRQQQQETRELIMRKEMRYVPYHRLHRSQSLEIARAWNHPLQTWIHLHLPHPNTSLFATKQMPKKNKNKKLFYKVRDANHEPAKKDTSQKKKAVGR